MVPLIICHLVVIFVCVIIAAFLLTRRSARDTVYFIALCLYIAVYTFGNILLLMSRDVAVATAALKVENIGIPAIAPFFLLSIIQLCAPGSLRKWMGFAAIFYSSFFTLVVLANEFHNLYYTSYGLVFDGWGQIYLDKGPLYYVNQLVVILCFLVAVAVLIRRLSVWTSRVRRQMSFILIGSFITLAGNVVNVLGVMPGRIDVAVYASGLSAVFFFLCILSNRLYDLVPLAGDLAIQTMDDAMIVLNADATYLFSNAAAKGLFPELRTMSGGSPIAGVANWPDALGEGPVPGQVNVTVPVEDEVRHFRCAVSRVDRANGEVLGWSVVMRDTTETVALMEQLQRLAVTDSLTGLYNRRHFVELVQHEQKSSAFKPKKLAMIMFDIDHFKVINDTYGHAAGDLVLIRVSDAVQSVLRASDILSRYGGEEFTILSTDTDINGAGIFAERLRQVIEDLRVEFEGNTIQVRASFGISEFDPGDSIDDAIEAADRAMYRAKAEGRNRVAAEPLLARLREDEAEAPEAGEALHG